MTCLPPTTRKIKAVYVCKKWVTPNKHSVLPRQAGLLVDSIKFVP